MEKQSSRLFVIIVAAVTLVALAIVLQPKVQEQLAPRLHTAWVAIEADGSGVAEVGPVDLAAGDGFTLHAVLEARDRQDRPVYYTEAPALSFAGQPVPPERLERWDRPRLIKVRWFTVEGDRPYMMLDADTGIAGFGLREFLRSDWPISWSVPGAIDAANDNHLAAEPFEDDRRFGTQRYHVRLELYRDRHELIPGEVVRSWGVDHLKTEVERFPTVRMTLPGAIAPASRVFGLTQLEAPPGADQELTRQIGELAAIDVAYSRLTVLRDQIRHAGLTLDDLSWTIVDLAGDARWGRDAGPGDLLRAGDRVVVLYRDRGAPGIIDYQDLCFDYVQGAAIRALDGVFIGAGNDVELASLGGIQTNF